MPKYFFLLVYVYMLFIHVFMGVHIWEHVCVCVCAFYSVHVAVRGQLIEISALLPPCGPVRSGSGHQAQQHVPLPAEPPQPLIF